MSMIVLKLLEDNFQILLKVEGNMKRKEEFFMKESSNYNEEIDKYHGNINEGEPRLPSFDTTGKYKLNPFEISLS